MERASARGGAITATIDGFYGVLDRDDEGLARALVSVAGVLQVRIKPGDARDILRIARMAKRVCDEAGAALVINDRVDLALAIGAAGVHLGQTDLPIADARRIAPGLVIGVSTHDLAQVRAACDAGADYLGFGPVFATSTKANPDPVQGIVGLAAACREAGRIPVVAIGGITRAHAAALYDAGAAAICAISAVTQAPDWAAEARALARQRPAV